MAYPLRSWNDGDRISEVAGWTVFGAVCVLLPFALYWALAVWSVGACVTLDEAEADVLVTDDPALAEAAEVPAVLVTLAALARSAPDGTPAGVVDEARELSTYADQFAPWEEPDAADLALRTMARSEGVLLDALAVGAREGSLVLSRGPASPERDRDRLVAEGVTLER